MQDNQKHHDHLVRFNEEKRIIEIYRIKSGYQPILYTEIAFDEASKKAFGEFARLLGENILMDSLPGRKLFTL
jgi:hypothetical protein